MRLHSLLSPAAVRAVVAAAALLLPLAVAAQPQPSGSEPSTVVGPPRGRPFTGEALEARTEEVGGLLRCPVCQGLSVADSPASMAVAMKAQVKELLALAAGGAVLVWVLRSRPRGTAPEPSAPLPGPGTLPDDPELARYVRRVRELAYGWPDGRPPGASD